MVLWIILKISVLHVNLATDCEKMHYLLNLNNKDGGSFKWSFRNNHCQLETIMIILFPSADLRTNWIWTILEMFGLWLHWHGSVKSCPRYPVTSDDTLISCASRTAKKKKKKAKRSSWWLQMEDVNIKYNLKQITFVLFFDDSSVKTKSD